MSFFFLCCIVDFTHKLIIPVPMMIAYVIQVGVSVKRINKFMNSEEINPNNVTNNPSENALSIDNGNFSWGGETNTLKNINMKVKKEKLTALVGPVGCGKTSLLSALLGEMDKVNGTVNVDGRVAYVPQQAWIQNATLQDNILFGRPMDEKFYEKVIHACALTADLAMLPGGDKTEIGEKGINLSGGQKQRVVSNFSIFICESHLEMNISSFRVWLELFTVKQIYICLMIRCLLLTVTLVNIYFRTFLMKILDSCVENLDFL